MLQTVKAIFQGGSSSLECIVKIKTPLIKCTPGASEHLWGLSVHSLFKVYTSV